MGMIKRIHDERGAALAIAIMVMVICAVLAAASMLTTTTDTQIAINDKIYHEALMNADAGIQWLRTQDLQTLSGQANMNAQNSTVATAGTPQGIRFSFPTVPQFVWSDPTAGGAAVYRVESLGQDRNVRGRVLVQAEIRMAPQEGEVISERECGYAGA